MGLYRCLIFHIKPVEKKKMMSEGKVKFFNANKRFGFIVQDEGEDLFFHASELRSFLTATEGDRVQYKIGEGKKGPCAVNIHEVRIP